VACYAGKPLRLRQLALSFENRRLIIFHVEDSRSVGGRSLAKKRLIKRKSLRKKSAGKKPDLHSDRLRAGRLQHQLQMLRADIRQTKKTISYQEIYGRFLEALGRTDVDLDWSMGKIFRGSGAAWDFAAGLMQRGPFAADGLRLNKREVVACKLVRDFLKLIIKWYEANGWELD
jgi:hypothetical protein